MDTIPDDHSMDLSATERQWALTLKAAVEQHDELENMTDMQYAHYALVTKGNVEDALVRVSRMQAYQRYYRVDGTPEQGLQCLQDLMALMPGFLLHLDVDPTREASIHAIDLGQVNPEAALGMHQGKEQWRTFTLGMYYIFYSCQPTLAPIRNGFFALVDFATVTYDNYSPETQQRLFEELVKYYPNTFTSLLAYNTHTVAHIKISLAKPFMPEHLRRAFQLGCRIQDHNNNNSAEWPAQLKEFYLQPSPQEAQKNLLESAKEFLQQRAHNERVFRL